MIAIFKKELSIFLSTLIGPLIICVFLLINGLLLWSNISEFNLLENSYLSLNSFFTLTPILFVLLVPAISMRIFTEEFNNSTFETLKTKPITSSEIVNGKILSVFSIVLLSLAPTFIYLITIFFISEDRNLIDYSGIFGSYIGLIMISLSFSSIGVFASSISKNQIVSLLAGISFSFILFYGSTFLSNMSMFKSIAFSLEKIGFLYHYNTLSSGQIQVSSIFYFLSISYLFSILSVHKINNLNV